MKAFCLVITTLFINCNIKYWKWLKSNNSKELNFVIKFYLNSLFEIICSIAQSLFLHIEELTFFELLFYLLKHIFVDINESQYLKKQTHNQYSKLKEFYQRLHTLWVGSKFVSSFFFSFFFHFLFFRFFFLFQFLLSLDSQFY